MKIKPKYARVASDLHLEGLLGTREEFLALTMIPPDPRDAESVLILAGDISSKPKQLVAFLGWLAPRFLKIIYVPGNHEFYGHEMAVWCMDIQAALGGYFAGEGPVECSGCGVEVEEMDGVRFIFGTLWGDGGYSIKEQGDIGNCLNDFRVVRLGDKRFTVNDMKVLHNAQRDRIKELLLTPFDGKTIVVTHHLPSYELCHPRFGTDINGGFASHCDFLFEREDTPFDVWVHGHTHDSIDKLHRGRRVVCNPHGYRFEKGSPYNTFGPKFIEIETAGQLEPVKPAFSG